MTARTRSLLVGVDFSEASLHAFDLALRLASLLDARLLLVHAWNPTGFAPRSGLSPRLARESDAWLEGARRVAEERLGSLAEGARDAGVAVEVRLERGAASRRLADLAQGGAVDLVVLGRSGHARLPHVMLGSVAERVVRLSPRPVLVVPEPAGEPWRAPRRLLVGIDYSEASRAALETAAALARDLGAAGGLLLANAVADEREVWLEHWEKGMGEVEWPYDRHTLGLWAAPAERAGLAVETRALPGRAETVLVELARGSGCDWIVVGVQGRTALASYLIGSTSDRVLRLSDRPVLSVPMSDAAAGELGA